MKIGRPRRGETRGTLHNINVRVDDETLADLEQLERAQPQVRGRRSVALREAIREAAKRLQKKTP